LLANSPLPPGILAFDADQKEYIAKPGEVNCPFVFTVTNISPGAVSIRFIQTSCGCTTSRIQLPMNLAPGATGEIPITMNVAGKTGVVPKTVTVHTDQGHRVLVVRANIQPPAANPAAEAMNRERNQQIAAADRQAVFKGDCAKCHVEPTVGKYGKDLYVAACGICHAAEHRATMVPDLHQLKVTPNAEYWRFFVENGKPGTLMPAFSVPQGGPLTDPQIESLVGYLVKEFPRERTNASAAAPAH
jgi:mono/diheme cytochrome c family protein